MKKGYFKSVIDMWDPRHQISGEPGPTWMFLRGGYSWVNNANHADAPYVPTDPDPDAPYFFGSTSTPSTKNPFMSIYPSFGFASMETIHIGIRHGCQMIGHGAHRFCGSNSEPRQRLPQIITAKKNGIQITRILWWFNGML